MMVSVFCLIGPQHPVRTFDPTNSSLRHLDFIGLGKPFQIVRSRSRDKAIGTITRLGFVECGVGFRTASGRKIASVSEGERGWYDIRIWKL